MVHFPGLPVARHAQVQRRRTLRSRLPLPHRARIASARGARSHRGSRLLRAPRPAPDREDHDCPGPRPALTVEGRYAAHHVSCEAGEPAQDDFQQAQRIVLGEIELSCRGPPRSASPSGPMARGRGRQPSSQIVDAWCRACPRPVVLFLDEIDALRGESLRSVLRQLRAGYPERPRGAPWSVVLCGLRDVRDYKAASGGDPSSSPARPISTRWSNDSRNHLPIAGAARSRDW